MICNYTLSVSHQSSSVNRTNLVRFPNAVIGYPVGCLCAPSANAFLCCWRSCCMALSCLRGHPRPRASKLPRCARILSVRRKPPSEAKRPKQQAASTKHWPLMTRPRVMPLRICPSSDGEWRSAPGWCAATSKPQNATLWRATWTRRPRNWPQRCRSIPGMALSPSGLRSSEPWKTNLQQEERQKSRACLDCSVKAAFDPDLTVRSVSLRVDDVDFYTAVSLLGVQTGTFWRPLNPTLMFVAQDTPE